jgi:hypothetical protein
MALERDRHATQGWTNMATERPTTVSSRLLGRSRSDVTLTTPGKNETNPIGLMIGENTRTSLLESLLGATFVLSGHFRLASGPVGCGVPRSVDAGPEDWGKGDVKCPRYQTSQQKVFASVV